jgi:hypothetical protein
MSVKYTGLRALGGLDPVTRSNLLKIDRAIRSLSQVQRTYPLPNEQEAARAPGLQQQAGYSSGGRSSHVIFGNDVDKPNTQYLLARGTGAFIYIAQDTNKVYMWNGTAYKSATFS